MKYSLFAAMIATSTLVMYGLMYLNTYELEHVFYSQTRLWMAFIMGSSMTFIMMGFMWSMYEDKARNGLIMLLAVVVFSGSLWLVRSQQTVEDVSYMKAMIPHHSIAVLTSSRAHIKDPRVQELADEIIEAQVREIAEMKVLISELEKAPVPKGTPDIEPKVPTGRND